MMQVAAAFIGKRKTIEKAIPADSVAREEVAYRAATVVGG